MSVILQAVPPTGLISRVNRWKRMRRMGVVGKSVAEKHYSDDAEWELAGRGGAGGAWSCCMEFMKEGMQRLGRWVRNEREACTIVNETGKEVVLRAKYRDVWEGQQWRLPAHGGHMVVPPCFLAHRGQPFNRLAAFLVTDPPFSSPPLFITALHMLHHRQIALSLSSASSLRIHPA